MNRQVLLGLIAAPLIASLAVWVLLALVGGAEANFWLPFIVPISLGCALLLGTPAHFLLSRLNATRIWHYTIAGLVIGLTPAPVLWALMPAENAVATAQIAAIFGAILGPLAAIVFWLIAVRSRESQAGV